MGGSFPRSSIVFTCGELWHKEKARKRCGGLHNGAHKHRRRVPLRAPGGGGLELLVHLQGCNLSLTRCYLGHTPAAHQDAPVRPSDLLLFANGYVVALSDSVGEAAGTPATRRVQLLQQTRLSNGTRLSNEGSNRQPEVNSPHRLAAPLASPAPNPAQARGWSNVSVRQPSADVVVQHLVRWHTVRDRRRAALTRRGAVAMTTGV